MRHAEWTIESRSAQLLLVALLVGAAESTAGGLGATPANRLAGARLIERLKRLPLEELERVAASGSLEIVVRLDADRAAWSAQAAARGREDQALLEYFVRHRASRELLRKLFGATRRRVAEIRRAQRVRPTQGRPKLPPRKEREAIQATWVRLSRSTVDLRARFRDLHRAFPHLTLAALDALVQALEACAQGVGLPPGKRSRTVPISDRAVVDGPDLASRRGSVVHRRERD